MEIKIVKAENIHVTDCKIALQKSELGKIYFPNENKAIRAIKEGISKREISIAIDKDENCLGFVWIIPNGAFHSFPYLHIIAVKEEYRSLGIGKALLTYFEEFYKISSKLFLVVADFNPRAKQLYENFGYKQVGTVPNLYKPGVTEYIMMKEL